MDTGLGWTDSGQVGRLVCGNAPSAAFLFFCVPRHGRWGPQVLRSHGYHVEHNPQYERDLITNKWAHIHNPLRADADLAYDFQEAVKLGDVDVVRIYVAAGCDLNKAVDNGTGSGVSWTRRLVQIIGAWLLLVLIFRCFKVR